jgi:hypothetical protein
MASANAQVRRRAAKLGKRTKERNAKKGKVKKAPRDTKTVQTLRALAGKPTLDDKYGGVPNHDEFTKLAPLYTSRDRNFSIYFPHAAHHKAASGKFWWRSVNADVPILKRGDVVVLGCRATNDDVQLHVEQAPNGQWQHAPGSTRVCTGDGIGRVTRT